jgi:GNAT superfamily N-acetyltransferase
MSNAVHIRVIDPNSEIEIELVAQRMRATLIEVEGEAAGTALHSMEWLRARVRWHLDGDSVAAEVFLAVDSDGEVIGHTIVRRELDAEGGEFGLVSTTYVVPHARRSGVADELLRRGENWFRSQSLQRCETWTSATNSKLIQLYAKHGYTQTAQHAHDTTGTPMVRLGRWLSTRADAEG